MKKLYYILLILFPSILLSEEVEIIIFSESFTIDTIDPEIEILSPSHGDSFQQGDQVLVTWQAYDQSPASHPMTLNVSANLDNPYFELASNFPNSGSLELGVPSHINTLFASIRLDIVDYFGNTTSAYSDGYFTLGNPNEQIYDVANEYVAIESTSAVFEIDTKLPEVTWIFPNESSSFIPGQGQVVRWQANDDSFIDNPVDLFFIDGGVDSYFLSEDNNNNEQAFINLPEITTSLGHFKVVATDRYGNMNYDLSDEYMSIGPNSNTELEEESSLVEVLSSPFTIDTKLPTFNLINETDYFYPNGGEILTDYNSVNLDWNCYDESFDNGLVEVSLAYLLGGWYTVVDTFHHSTFYSAPIDLSLNGLVDNTIWGRMIFTAIDDFGNRQSQYNDDYFVLGSSDGDIDIELADEDDLEMMLSWTWETEQHTIVILNRAINFLEDGDQIAIIGENAVNNTDCELEDGYLELERETVDENSSQYLKIRPIKTHIGINHCESGGGKLQGYTEQDSIRFMVTNGDESYFIRPDNFRGSLVFNNGTTVIDSFNPNPYTLDVNDQENISIAINERDDDNFNVYSKVTNHQSSFRNCDNDGVCDSSELLPSYINEDDCLANSGIWDVTYCYYDYNNDGQYSPDEVDENIGDCYSDCCSSQGTGENTDWCFVEEVSEQVYTHGLVQQNYVANQQSSATINYRVWVLDQNGDELFKTVDTDGVDINIDANSIGTYERSLLLGWNWFSLNVIDGNSNMSINNIFLNSNPQTGDYIKSQTTSSQYYTSGGTWYPELTLNLQDMFMANMSEDDLLMYTGLNATNEDTIFINSGWNWISYLPQESLSINTALSTINPSNGDYIKSQTQASTYYTAGNMWYPDIVMNPTEGYMLNSATIDTLVYLDSRLQSNLVENSLPEALRWDVSYRDYEFNASATLSMNTDNYTISENDQIAVFVDGVCRGVCKAEYCPLNDQIVFNLMYYSNNLFEDDYQIIYYNSISDKEVDVNETLAFEADTYLGNALEPIVLYEFSIPTEYELKNPFPNPFNPITRIDYSLPNDTDNLNITIYDVRGRIIKELESGFKNKGNHSLNWNASEYASGIYFINMTVDGYNFNRKITLLK